MPLQFGLLTGKFDDHFEFPENDHRNKRITKEIVSATNEALFNVWQLCQKYECNKTQLALSYLLSYDAVSTIIPGIRTAAHVTDNTSGLFTLDSADKALIENTNTTDLLQLILKQG
jgi:aryl-alcohol dehydrogenase-like predicted oxidoreductase